jgi:hypothetical protein
MLPLLLLLVAAQVPGETSLVTFCKQGRLTACEALKQANPQQAAQLRAELARAAARQAALKAAEEEARENGATEAGADAEETEAEAASESCDCKGQDHHVISRPIARALKEHNILSGLYEPRDKRFVAKAKNLESHCGYQKWHRAVDEEVIQWLDRFPKASQKQFEAKLREIYRRPEMLERFPHAF